MTVEKYYRDYKYQLVTSEDLVHSNSLDNYENQLDLRLPVSMQLIAIIYNTITEHTIINITDVNLKNFIAV